RLMSCGSSLVWNPEALKQICPFDSARSLREFLRLHEAGWPEGDLQPINNRYLVVAGLEAAMDTLRPDEAAPWFEITVYRAINDFQRDVADGGREAALVFWMAEPKRIWHASSSAGSK